MSLEADIAGWDGKAVDEITAVLAAHREAPRFVATVVGLVDIPACEVGASWLLKAWLEDGGRLTKAQTRTLLSSLDALERWEAKLHLLQCLPLLVIADGQTDAVETFLRSTLTDANKFVRAWAYNGFCELARQHAGYRAEAELLLDQAVDDEAPSVKARIRNIRKRGF